MTIPARIRVADVCELGDGAHASVRRRTSGIPYLTSKNIGRGELKLDSLDYISEEDYERLFPPVSKSVTRLREGDVLTGIIGTFSNSYVYRSSDTFGISSAIAVLRPNKSYLSSKYLYYYLNSPQLQSLKEAVASGSVQGYTNLTVLGSLPLILPSLEEQQAIVEVLGALDDKIAVNTKLSRTIEALGSAKFTHLGLDVEPTNEVVLLGELFDLNPRRTVISASPTVIDMQALPTAEPLVERWTTGVRKGGARFTNGDTLVARITPCLENRKTAFVDFLEDGDVGIGSTEFIVMRSKNDLPLGLSYFMAVSERFRDFAIQNLVGTSGRQRVSASDLARHTLHPVGRSALRTFGEWADANLEVLGSLRSESRTLATMRDVLLPQLMSGKIHVKEAEELVAAI